MVRFRFKESKSGVFFIMALKESQSISARIRRQNNAYDEGSKAKARLSCFNDLTARLTHDELRKWESYLCLL